MLARWKMFLLEGRDLRPNLFAAFEDELEIIQEHSVLVAGNHDSKELFHHRDALFELIYIEKGLILIV